MKGNKLELLYLILSIVLLTITSFFYLSNSKKELTVQQTFTQTDTSSNEETTNNSNTEKIVDLTKRLTEIAKSPNKDSVTAIKKEIHALEKGSDKTRLLKVLSDVEKDLATIASIEANLGLAQNSGEPGYLQTAQTAIDSLKAETKKAELQALLDEIAIALSASQADTSSETDEAPDTEATEEIIVQEETISQGVHTPVYSNSPNYTYTPATPTTTIPDSIEPVVTVPEEPAISPDTEIQTTPSEMIAEESTE